MLQNKIYQNYVKNIIKTFFTFLLGFSLLALTVRSVNFLDLIVDSGYAITTYFKFSLLNIFGILPKFIPLSFLLALIFFIIRRKEDNEFLVLWTSGVNKIKITNLFLLASVFVLIFYLIMSTFITPYALNKSRESLKKENFNSFLPTIRSQQFSDSYKGFTFFVERKINDKIKNIFLHDTGNNLKNLTSNSSDINEIIIFAQDGLVKERNLFLLNGNIISSKNDLENEIVKFEQLQVNLENLSTTTIKARKIQETPTIKLLSCFFDKNINKNYCNDNFKKEIISSLNRRITIPFYLPLLSLLCSILLISSTKIYFNNKIIYVFCFLILLFTELIVRYTGLNNFVNTLFILLPFGLIIFIYSFLLLKFSNELKKNEQNFI